MFALKLRNSIALLAITLAASSPTLALSQETAPLVIADKGSSYGMPAPFLHKQNGPGYIMASYMFDTLAAQDGAGELVPGLAADWSLSEDGLTYTVTLQPDAKWQDGAAVTPQDVAFSLSYYQTHPYAFVSLGGIKDVSAQGAEVTITLQAPDAGFVNRVFAGLPILPQHIYDGQDDPRLFDDAAALTGSGPYKLAGYDRAQGRYDLVAVEDYYGGTVKYNKLIFARLSEEAALAGISKGEVDLIPYLSWQQVPHAKELGIKVLSAPSNHPLRLVFNHAGLFGAVKARQALASLIDRQSIADIAYSGGATVADPGYFQSGTPWYVQGAQASYAFDPERGAELLEQAGLLQDDSGHWLHNASPVQLSLITDASLERPAKLIAEQLEKAGFAIDLRIVEAGALQEAISTNAYDLALSTTSTLGEPSGLAARIFGQSWRGDRYSGDSEMQRLLDEQAEATDPEARHKLLTEFQTLYAQNLPSLFLVNPIWNAAHSDRFIPAWLPEGVATGIPSPISKPVLLTRLDDL